MDKNTSSVTNPARIVAAVLITLAAIVTTMFFNARAPVQTFEPALELYVAGDGGVDLDNDCRLFTRPCATIGAALKTIDVIPHRGVTVNVAPGTYSR